MLINKAKVLFVCSGNPARSVMALGWAGRLGTDCMESRAASTDREAVHPLTQQVMSEEGIDTSGLSTEPLTPELLEWADLVVTVCGKADVNCPVLPPGVRKIHWPLENPATVKGDGEQQLTAFRRARKEARHHVEGMINGIKMMAS